MRIAAPLVVLVVVLTITGCGNAPTSPPPVASAPTTTSSTPATTAPATAPSAAVGESVTNKGITLTVKTAGPVDSIQMNESNSRPGSGYEKYTTTKPDAGGRFVAVTAHVVNNAQVSLDLTCGLPITTKLIDAQQRNFDAIPDLYKIKGNPECNHQLQPGFEDDMTWVYLVPTSATVIGWGFLDSTVSGSSSGDYATVRFDA